MKKFLKAIILLLAFTTVFIFSGCSDNFMEDLMTDYEADEELFVVHASDFHTYTYSEKVKINMLRHNNLDSLEVKTGTDEDCFWNVILEDDFEKVAWNDYKIFILYDSTYYVFDIEKYEVPENKYDDPVYEIMEYSSTQMEELYPDYESFDWFQTWVNE